MKGFDCQRRRQAQAIPWQLLGPKESRGWVCRWPLVLWVAGTVDNTAMTWMCEVLHCLVKSFPVLLTSEFRGCLFQQLSPESVAFRETA